MSFLRNTFGPSKKEIWAQIAQDIGGDFIEGSFWKKDTLTYTHGEWIILLDTYAQSTGTTTTIYTRIRVPFVNKNELRFKIYREHYFSKIGKFFGMQDIIIGDPFFDDEFIIKGNDEYSIKRLLKSKELKTLIKNQPNVHLEIKNDEGAFSKRFPDGVDMLYFQSLGVITKKEVLLNLFELFSTLLDRLVEVDAAYKTNPRVYLK